MTDAQTNGGRRGDAVRRFCGDADQAQTFTPSTTGHSTTRWALGRQYQPTHV